MKLKVLKLLSIVIVLSASVYAFEPPPGGAASPEPASTALIGSALVALVYKNKKR